MAQNLTIRRGETFNYTLRWMCDPVRYIPISKISDSLPIVLTCKDHGIFTGTPVTVINGKAKTQSTIVENATAIAIDTDTIQLDTDEAGIKAFSKADYVRTYTYVNLRGMTGRCYFKKAVGSPILFELTTENGRIAIDETNNAITLTINALDTEQIAFDSAKYDLELVSGGTVVRLVEGNVSVEGEITV